MPAGNPKIEPSGRGRVFTFNGVGDRYGITSSYSELTGPGTFFCFLPTVGASDTFGHIYFRIAGLLSLQIGDANQIFINGGSTSLVGTVSGSWFNTKNRSVIWAMGASTSSVYIDGQLVVDNFSTTFPTLPATNKDLQLAGSTSGDVWDLNGQILSAGWTSVRWGASEARAFHDNPWQIFKAPKRSVFVPSSIGGGSPQDLTPDAAEAIATAGAPSLSAGVVTLAPSAPSATAEAGTPALVAGAVNIDSLAAIAVAGVSGAEFTTDGSVLTPQVAISTAGVDNPILVAGAVALEPSAASATAGVTDPNITNGAQLSPTAASASATASTPTLSAGGVSVNVDAAVASASAESAALTAGGVQLSASAAIAVAVASVPEMTSGRMIDSVPATAVAGVDSPSFVAGLANIIAISAEGSAAASAPIFSIGQASLLPLAAIATAIVEDAFLIDGGMQWHSEMLYSIPAEDRSFIIAAENRAYSVPAV